jgi:DNA-binding transcriptional ArsR family regulator
VLEQLGRADASITNLAEKFHMTLTGMKKHVGVLEQAGLVTTEKVGRVRTCQLGLRRLEGEGRWTQEERVSASSGGEQAKLGDSSFMAAPPTCPVPPRIITAKF